MRLHGGVAGCRTWSDHVRKANQPNETAIAHAVSYTTSIFLRLHTTLTVLRLSSQQVLIKSFVVRCQQQNVSQLMKWDGFGCMSALLFRIPGHQTSHYVAKAQRRHVFHYPRQKSYQHKTSETTSCGWADAKEFMSTQKHFNKFPWICDTTQVPLPGNHVQAHTRWLMSTQKRVNESPWHRYTMKCKVLTSYEGPAVWDVFDLFFTGTCSTSDKTRCTYSFSSHPSSARIRLARSTSVADLSSKNRMRSTKTGFFSTSFVSNHSRSGISPMMWTSSSWRGRDNNT